MRSVRDGWAGVGSGQETPSTGGEEMNETLILRTETEIVEAIIAHAIKADARNFQRHERKNSKSCYCGLDWPCTAALHRQDIHDLQTVRGVPRTWQR